MNLIIVGPGAMGLLWYHHIGQLFSKSPEYPNSQLHLLSSKSFPLKHDDSSNRKQAYCFTDHNNQTYNNSIHYAQIKNIEQADIILLCVKSFQIASALKNIVNHLKKNSVIILSHNGMGTVAELPTEIEKDHAIYTLLTTHGCLRSAPFCITHTGVGSSDLGLLLGASNATQQQSLTQLLNTALPDVNYQTNIKQKQWLKLAINCVINPLTAINNLENGQINNVKYQSSITLLLNEIIAVASAEGVRFDLHELKQRVKEVAQATAKNCSSMRCDILAKRRSEIDYINGYIHHLGITHGIATPENTMLWQTVKNLESEY